TAEHEHVVGLDGIVVIVSPRNPVAKLSLEQLQGIFSGAIFDWSQIGGAAGRINVYARDAKSGRSTPSRRWFWTRKIKNLPTAPGGWNPAMNSLISSPMIQAASGSSVSPMFAAQRRFRWSTSVG